MAKGEEKLERLARVPTPTEYEARCRILGPKLAGIVRRIVNNDLGPLTLLNARLLVEQIDGHAPMPVLERIGREGR